MWTRSSWSGDVAVMRVLRKERLSSLSISRVPSKPLDADPENLDRVPFC
jgi:hypothetical protein